MNKEGLVLEHICAGYARQQILYDISLHVDSGEICGIIGPNGSGKTTLFCALMHTGAWSTGRCLVDEADILQMKPKERARKMALLPQVLQAPPGYLCEDILELAFYPYLGFLQAPTGEMKREIGRIMREMRIEHLAQKSFSMLSEGQKQMVLLGCILLQNAPVLLLDEPDQSLDFSHKHQMLQRFQKFIQNEKKCCLMILHDPDAALTYCDRIYLMKEGKIFNEIHTRNDSYESMEEKLQCLYPCLKIRHKNDIFHVEYDETLRTGTVP